VDVLPINFVAETADRVLSAWKLYTRAKSAPTDADDLGQHSGDDR
jgi:hypothetical protein